MKRIFIDVETTGLNPQKSGIWQLAAIADVRGKPIEVFNQKMGIYKNKTIDNNADLTGDNFSFLDGLQDPKDVYYQFVSFLKKYIDPYNRSDKAVFIAYNAYFDYQFMRQWFIDSGDKFFGSFFWFPYIDVMQLAGHVIYSTHARVGMKNFKLQTIAEALDIKVDTDDIEKGFHDALYDIKVTQLIYQFLIKKIEVKNE